MKESKPSYLTVFASWDAYHWLYNNISPTVYMAEKSRYFQTEKKLGTVEDDVYEKYRQKTRKREVVDFDPLELFERSNTDEDEHFPGGFIRFSRSVRKGRYFKESAAIRKSRRKALASSSQSFARSRIVETPSE